MTGFDTPAKWPRYVTILTAWVFLLVADGAFAKNGGNSDNHQMKSGNSEHKEKHKDKDKSDDKHTEKNKKHKDKDKEASKDKTPVKEKAPVIISGGYVRDKLPNGTEYYRRATQAELEKAAKANGGATTTTGNSGGTTGTGGTTTTGNAPPPAAPAGDTGPVVRDHRPGGNAAYPVPGTIVRDHTNGKDGTPYVVVSAGPTGTVTRKATDADLEKAGLKKPAAPSPVTVPIGMGGGGR